MNRVGLVELERIPDPRGNLTFLQEGQPLPFPVRRAYWIYEVPGGARRGGHAYRKLEEMFIALSGSFDVSVDDGRESRTYQLNRSYLALYVPPLIWRRLENFSTNAVCMILASRHYEEEDYLYDRDDFLATRARA
jgi:dTDP-4-dehydrorhamnose 3,5-epimerase-like enzyme